MDVGRPNDKVLNPNLRQKKCCYYKRKHFLYPIENQLIIIIMLVNQGHLESERQTF